jgi:para-nitrobenzyl esterase
MHARRTIKRRAVYAAWMMAAHLNGSAHAAAPDPAPRVRLDTGDLAGAVQHGVESFLGVPYAAPPVGPWRWRPPQPVRPWSGVRSADGFGNDCMQLRQRAGNGRATPAEDCLYLNVWRPAARPAGSRLPVLVWIYGGGFVVGGASEPLQDGATFAREGLVVVSFNYRLGRFGFFGFPALTREHPAEPQGNYGFMDQIAALEWVRRHIAAFGGDPRRVTVMGESAGGESIAALLAAPPARGLFQRVILQSSGARTALTGIRRLKQDLPGLPSAETLGRNFATSLGIQGEGAAALQQLRSLPAAAIAAGVDGTALRTGSAATTYGGPLLDGRIVPEEPRAAYLAGRTSPVDVLCGATNADLGKVDADSKDDLFERFGARRAAAIAAYDPRGDAPLERLQIEVGGDQLMVEPARELAVAAAARGLPAYEYRFSYVAQTKRDIWRRGAPHGSDVPYAFDTLSLLEWPAGPDGEETARLFHRYLAQFALTGAPNGTDLPEWPRYSASADVLLVFADGVVLAEPDPWRERLNLVQDAHLDVQP